MKFKLNIDNKNKILEIYRIGFWCDCEYFVKFCENIYYVNKVVL